MWDKISSSVIGSFLMTETFADYVICGGSFSEKLKGKYSKPTQLVP